MTPLQLGCGPGDFAGDWEQYLDYLYSRYSAAFIQSHPQWPEPAQRWVRKKHPEIDGMCGTFWHIITEGDSDSRVPDVDRCERIDWPRALLDAFCASYPQRTDGRIVWWRTERGGKKRIVIALWDFSYVVVIDDRPKYAMLWTAYPVERRHRRDSLRREHDDYWR